MNLFFDTLIILFLFSTAALAVVIFRDRQSPGTWESRHKVITRTVFMF